MLYFIYIAELCRRNSVTAYFDSAPLTLLLGITDSTPSYVSIAQNFGFAQSFISERDSNRTPVVKHRACLSFVMFFSAA